MGLQFCCIRCQFWNFDVSGPLQEAAAQQPDLTDKDLTIEFYQDLFYQKWFDSRLGQ